ncbi:hypothetical protein NPIL_79331 [Nephila pilipes]|uniref:Uncharacterized protein n=1 Tax=Nephila pilipes TaxID=299642 RepID=A0A8X6TU25_NEPPI|nr:hypothetical protein NPIL_79331 [Nephila pilipes]
MIIVMIFEVCLHFLQWALRAIAGLDLLYFIEIILFDLMIEFFYYATTQFFSAFVLGRATTQDTTVAAAVLHSPTVQKTCEALELHPKLVPQQVTTTVTGTPYEQKDPLATIPVVRSLFVFKICQALDLPANFVPQESDSTLSCQEFKVNKPVPIVYSIVVFEICKALELKAELAHQ